MQAFLLSFCVTFKNIICYVTIYVVKEEINTRPRWLNNAVQSWTGYQTTKSVNLITLVFRHQCESSILRSRRWQETAANSTWAPKENNTSIDYTTPAPKEITSRLYTLDFVDASALTSVDNIATEQLNSKPGPVDSSVWGSVASCTWKPTITGTCHPPIDNSSWGFENLTTWESKGTTVGGNTRYTRVVNRSWGPGDKIIWRPDDRIWGPISSIMSYPPIDTSTWGLGDNSTRIPDGNYGWGQVISTTSHPTIVNSTSGHVYKTVWRSVDNSLCGSGGNATWNPGNNIKLGSRSTITWRPIGSTTSHSPIDNSTWDSLDKNTGGPISTGTWVSKHSMRLPVDNINQEPSINRTSTATNKNGLAVGDKIHNINNRPIIGVLTQEQSSHLNSKYPTEKFTSYIASSYVKLVESSGARVVPILIGKCRKYYEDLMAKINGVLFPGGATYFNQSDGFADAGQHIYEIAQKYNDAGDYFPIFGICLGFELLMILASGRGEEENRVACYSYSNKPLNFTPDFRTSKMFRPASEDVISILANEDVTVNAHQFCIIDENFESYHLTEDWRVTSYSEDDYGKEFIASVEHKRYPFYGVQFHPEKSSFEWKSSKNYPHSANAIKANRYFMDFFVAETRKNINTFGNVYEENECLIYNYEPYFTGALGSVYLQCYFFEPRVIDDRFTDDEVT